ncbi:MAG TPA: ABC transporter permease [Gemmatimonadaceae bacterium]|nr:ABC transporter permease [Gemmatimonadaceae bacterium]
MADRPHPMVELTRVRLREYLREPEAVFWTLFFPILLAAGLGLAFRSRPAEQMRVAVVVSERAGEAAADALAADERLRVERTDSAGAALALRQGRVVLAVHPGGAGAEMVYDPDRPEAAVARLVADDALQRGAGRRDVVSARDRHISERGWRYIDFVLPGLLGMTIMGTSIWGIGFTIVDARRRKLLKRLIATPMSRAQYLASFMTWRLFLLVLEVVVLVGFGALVFGVPVRGSIVQLATVALMAGVAFGAIGLLVAARPRTVEGVSGLMNLVMFPMWVASGVFFSATNFPDAIQPAIQALPLTAANDALRLTMLEGAGWSAVAPELAVLGAWLAVSFPLALRLFRWR